MVRVYCDKCGVDCKGYEITLEVDLDSFSRGCTREIHLCNTCYKALNKWLRQKLPMN